jgi:site-specific DNA recombinase
MHAIIYARFSTEHQTEATIIDQVRRCRDYASARGWPVDGVFTDEGISGAALGNRPGVRAALDRLGVGDVMLVVDTTRLSRSQDLAPMLTRLRHRGVRVIGVLDGFDSDSHTARMQAGLSGIMSEEFRASIAARTHSALDMRARDGRATGGRCYGFDRAGGIVDAEAAVVREIFRRVAVGDTQKGIAADLNARGVPAPGASWERRTRRADGVWMAPTLNAMLANERYTGRVVWNRSAWRRDPDSGVRQRVERPEAEWIVRDGPAIVDRVTFDRVRAIAAPRRLFGGRPGGGPRYLLSGILTCGVCGRRMIASGRGGSHYYCGTHKAGGAAACPMSVGARRDVAERVLIDPIRRDLLSPDAVAIAADMIRAWDRAERVRGVTPPDLAAIDARTARLEAQIAAGTIEREDVQPALAALAERRQGAAAAAWRRAGSRPGVDAEAAVAAYTRAVGAMRETLSAGPIARAREALHSILGDVVCRPADGTLVAFVGINPRPLFEAAGISWNGSGGAICVQEIPVRIVDGA